MALPASLFGPLVFRPLWGLGRAGDRLRTALSLISVGLGVGVILAIQLANQAAIGSFEESLGEVSGRTNLSITAPGGIDELLLPRLQELLGPDVKLSPVIDAAAVIPSTRETVQVLGVDVLADRPFRNAQVDRTSLTERDFLTLLADPQSILVGENLARRYRLAPGAQIPLLVSDHQALFTVRGVLAPEGAGKALAGNLVLMDIAAAQLAFGRLGRLDRVDLIVPPEELNGLEAKLAGQLPAGLSAEQPEARAEQTDKMLSAFRWNLTALSYVSILVGAFLIYNTIAVSVVRRRKEIGTLRALGATRSQVLSVFLAEALLLGLAGGLVGIVLGQLLAKGALTLISGTVNTIYLPETPGALRWSAGMVVEALVIGGATALLSALPPALETIGILPAEALQQGAHEHQRRLAIPRYAAASTAVLALAYAAARLPPVNGLPLFGYLSVLLVIVGFALLLPLLLHLFVRLVDAPLHLVLGVEGRLAARGLAASPSRISVLTMALATAVAMMSSVAIMVGSFRQTVEVWAAQTLRADLLVKPAAQPPGSYAAVIPPEAIELARATPGVRAVDPFRGLDAVYRGNRIVLGSGDWPTLMQYGNLLFVDGRTPRQVMSGDASRSVVVSEPFANHYAIHSGQQIALDTPAGSTAFQVAGIYYDYTNDRGTVVLDRATFERLFHDHAASNLAVYLNPGADLERVSALMAESFGGHGYQLLITPNAQLQAAVLRVFDRTFSITYALEAVALLVAALGIANALLAWVLEQRREFGVLRVIGASRNQLRKMIVTDAALVGLLGIGVGALMGLLLSIILIFTINKQSFGWTIQFHFPGAFLGLAFVAIFLVTVLSGLYPARVAGRFRPAEVLAIE